MTSTNPDRSTPCESADKTAALKEFLHGYAPQPLPATERVRSLSPSGFSRAERRWSPCYPRYLPAQPIRVFKKERKKNLMIMLPFPIHFGIPCIVRKKITKLAQMVQSHSILNTLDK